MKAASVKELKFELKERSQKELLEYCLRLSKFKKENKELLTYLLFESYDEFEYIKNVKEEANIQFEQINRKSYYYIKKSIRKILSNIKKHIRYSQKKETEAELMIYFCTKLNEFRPSIQNSTALQNLYNRQIESVKKTILSLHEDLQYDYNMDLENLIN